MTHTVSCVYVDMSIFGLLAFMFTMAPRPVLLDLERAAGLSWHRCARQLQVFQLAAGRRVCGLLLGHIDDTPLGPSTYIARAASSYLPPTSRLLVAIAGKSRTELVRCQ